MKFIVKFLTLNGEGENMSSLLFISSVSLVDSPRALSKNESGTRGVRADHQGKTTCGTETGDNTAKHPSRLTDDAK